MKEWPTKEVLGNIQDPKDMRLKEIKYWCMSDQLKQKLGLYEEEGSTFEPNKMLRAGLEVHTDKFNSGLWKVPTVNKTELIPGST